MSDRLHHLLRTQLATARLDALLERDAGFATFVRAVDRTYRQADRHCARLESSLDRTAAKLRNVELGRAHPASGARKILVVEQDPIVRGFVCYVLERAGHEVLDTGDPCEAVAFAALTTEHIGALVTNVNMRDLGGQQVYAAVAAHRPALRVVYIASCDVIVDAPLLRRPFTPAALRLAIGAALAA
jgi:CheY-like chemotaxis protein